MELVVCKVPTRRFPSVINTRSLVERAPGVDGKEPVINNVTILGVEAVEEFGVLNFVRELVGEAKGVTDLQETPVIEQKLIFISDARLGRDSDKLLQAVPGVVATGCCVQVQLPEICAKSWPVL